MRLKGILIILLSVISLSYSHGQNFAEKDFYLIDSLVLEKLDESNKNWIDSLLPIFHSAHSDTAQLSILSTILEGFWDSDAWPKYNAILLKKSQSASKTASNEAIRKVAQTFEGCAHLNTAYSYMRTGPNSRAKNHFNLAIESFEKSGDKRRLGLTLMGLAVLHSNAGDYIESMQLGEKAIDLLKGTENYESTLSCYHNMSVIQLNIGNTEEAAYYTRLTYKFAVAAENKRLQCVCLDNFIDYMIRDEAYEKALDTSLFALQVAKEVKNVKLFLNLYYKIARIKVYLNEFDDALKWTQRLDSVNRIVKSSEYDIKFNQLKLDIFIETKNYNKARNAGLAGLRIARQNNQNLDESSILKRLAKIAYQSGQSNLAADYLFQVLDLQNKTAKDESVKLGIKQVLQYQYNKQKEIDDLKNKQRIALANAEKQKASIALISAVMIGLMIGLFALYIFNRLKLIRSQKSELDAAYAQLEESKNNELAVSNLKALQSQMNPHFIFNALNSVQDLVLMQDVRSSNKYLGKFSDLIRKILLSSKKQFISLPEELEILSLYLDLEKLRFGDDFIIDFQCNITEEEREKIKLPAMFIQPYIENAIKHGLFHKKGIKKLRVCFDLKENQLVCIVEDNGVGQEQAEVFKVKNLHLHTGFSTEAINDRIRLLNETLDRKIILKTIDLIADDKPQGTRVKLMFPI